MKAGRRFRKGAPPRTVPLPVPSVPTHGWWRPIGSPDLSVRSSGAGKCVSARNNPHSPRLADRHAGHGIGRNQRRA